MGKRYDVIIVGARVAGASLAILLGKMGKSVLLIDKTKFPSDTLSTHYMSHVDYLRKLGILEEIEGAGLRKVSRMRTYIGSSFIEGPRTSYTIIPKRDLLDDVLINKALQHKSVSLREECFVRDLIWDGNQVTGVAIEDRNGNKDTLKSDIVVGADGKNSNIAHWVGALEYQKQKPLRPVVYGYYENVEPLIEPTTEIFLNQGRIGFLFPMEKGRDCLGIELQPKEFKTVMKSPEENFEKMFRQLYGMDDRMKEATLQGKIIGTPGMPNFFRQAYGEGWTLIGDAGHSKDPSTGLGINDAFLQSFLLAEAIRLFDEGKSWSEVMNSYEQKRNEHLMPGFQLTLDYIQSMRSWTKNEESLFQAIAANPMVWNKIVPSISEHLKNETRKQPLLYKSVEMDAQSFGFNSDL